MRELENKSRYPDISLISSDKWVDLSWCFARWEIWQHVYSSHSWLFHFSSSSLKGLSQKCVRSLVLIEINSEKCKSRLGYLVQLGGKPFVSLSLSESNLKLPAFWDLQKCFVFYVDLLSGNSYIPEVACGIFTQIRKDWLTWPKNI